MHPTHTPPVDAALPPFDLTAADILRSAARYLELHGWRQGALYAGSSHTPAACAIGAIGMAACGGRLAPTNPRGARPTYRAATHRPPRLPEHGQRPPAPQHRGLERHPRPH